MSTSVSVQLLGPVRAFVDGDRVALRGRSARTVLARLALEPGQVVSVDQLAEALWDDDPPEEPTQNLRSVVSRLRTQLGRDAIVTDGAGYRLEPALVEVDIDQIERALRARRLAESDPDELAALLRRWDGAPFDDVAWTPVFEPERVRVDELRARLTDSYYAAMLRHDRADEALAGLERVAAAAPLRESTQMLLMRALDRCGRTADALRAGNDYRRRLVESSGLDPSPGYVALTRALLDPKPDDEGTADPSGDAPPASRRPWVPPDTPFVGRRTELADLRQLVRDHRLVTVTGPGGAGKTRLVAELMNDVEARPSGNIDMVALASLDRTTAVDTAVATALGLEIASGDALGPLADRLSSHDGVLVLDNCEHVLSGTRALVEHLLRDVASLHIVLTSRIRLGSPAEAILDIGSLAVPFEDAADSAPVHLFIDRVQRTTPTIDIAAPEIGVVVDICRLLDGLPLALELAAARVAMLGFGGLRQHLLDGLALPRSGAADGDRRQATIESTVEWSLSLLTPDARRLFDELSVFPSWFTLDALAKVSTVDRTVDTLSEIVDSSLVVIDHQGPAYRLLEPVRQVVRRSLDDAERDRVTGRYLEWVESVVAEIAEHWVRDERSDAQRLVVGRREDLRFALHQLIAFGDAASHGRVALVLARVLVDRSDRELVDLCRANPGPSLDGDLARCMLATIQGDAETSMQFAREIERQITPDSPRWGESHWIRAPPCLYTGDVDQLAHHASIAAADDSCSAAERSESIAMWALGLLYSGQRDSAAALLEEHQHTLDLSECGGFIAYTRAEVVAETDPDLALDFLAESSALAHEAEATFTQRLTDISQLVLLVAAGRRTQAAALAMALVPELMLAGTAPQAWTAMRHVADLLGQLDEPALGLLVLDSADSDDGAPVVVGSAVRTEADLRARLRAQAGSTRPAATLQLGALWERVEVVMRAAASGG